MKASYFLPASYLEPESLKVTFPQPPGDCVPALAHRSYEYALELAERAEELGFDWISFSQHHADERIMTPNPLIFASAVAQRVKRPKIAILGSLVPLLNPVRLAEELAMLDQVTGGRLVAGLLRGIPKEFLTYGTNSEETRGQYAEAVELIKRAWTEPETFAWQGRYYQYRTVSVWPQPLQDPHPPMILSTSSKASASFAARLGAGAGVSFPKDMETTAELLRFYREECAAAGWKPTDDDVVMRGYIYVAETDEDAIKDTVHDESVVAIRPDDFTRQVASGQVGVVESLRQMMSSIMSGSFGIQFMGSPATVVEQVRELTEATGIRVIDFIFESPIISRQAARRSFELFGQEVLPAIHQL